MAALDMRVLGLYIVSTMQTLTQDALLVASRQELIDQILALQERLQAKSSKVEKLEFQLDFLKRQLFGTKSERFVPPSDLQMMLDLGIGPSTEATGGTEKISYERRRAGTGDSKAGHGRGTMPTHLPIVNKTILPEGDVSGLKLIGEEMSWHFEMKPSSLYVVKITRPKYGLPKGEGVLCGELPPLPINKGNAGPGLMTQVTVDEHVYHVPLDRQRKRFKSEYAVDFSASWLSDLVKNTVRILAGSTGGYRSFRQVSQRRSDSERK